MSQSTGKRIPLSQLWLQRTLPAPVVTDWAAQVVQLVRAMHGAGAAGVDFSLDRWFVDGRNQLEVAFAAQSSASKELDEGWGFESFEARRLSDWQEAQKLLGQWRSRLTDMDPGLERAWDFIELAIARELATSRAVPVPESDVLAPVNLGQVDLGQAAQPETAETMPVPDGLPTHRSTKASKRKRMAIITAGGAALGLLAFIIYTAQPQTVPGTDRPSAAKTAKDRQARAERETPANERRASTEDSSANPENLDQLGNLTPNTAFESADAETMPVPNLPAPVAVELPSIPEGFSGLLSKSEDGGTPGVTPSVDAPADAMASQPMMESAATSNMEEDDDDEAATQGTLPATINTDPHTLAALQATAESISSVTLSFPNGNAINATHLPEKNAWAVRDPARNDETIAWMRPSATGLLWKWDASATRNPLARTLANARLSLNTRGGETQSTFFAVPRRSNPGPSTAKAVTRRPFGNWATHLIARRSSRWRLQQSTIWNSHGTKPPRPSPTVAAKQRSPAAQSTNLKWPSGSSSNGLPRAALSCVRTARCSSRPLLPGSAPTFRP